MNAIEEAIGYYKRNTPQWLYQMEHDMFRFIDHNPLISICSTELFVLAWPVSSKKSPWFWCNDCSPVEEQDAWYIHLMCGDLKLAMEVLPKIAKPLPYIVFQRGERSTKVHKISWDRLLRKGDRA